MPISRAAAVRVRVILAILWVLALTLVTLESLPFENPQSSVLVWLRVSRIVFEICLGAFLTYAIIRKERSFRVSLMTVSSKRKHAEDQLAVEQERMSVAFEAAGIGLWDHNMITGGMVWSDICKSHLGVPLNTEASFDLFLKCLHPEDRQRVQQSISSAVTEKKEYKTEFRVLQSDGESHWYVARGRAFYDKNGHPFRMVGISLNVDDRKAVEARLNLQAAALEAAANAIVITDSKGNIQWVNRAFTELTGYAPEQAIGQNPRMLKSWEHDKTFYHDLWSTIQSGRVWNGEIKNRKKDGTLYMEAQTITPVRSASGEISHYIGIKQDVTEQKRLEAQFRQAQKMEAIGRLAGGVAHDFNNILAVITGYSEISLEQLRTEDPVGKNLAQIKAAAERAASLTRQLLAFSRQQVVYPKLLNVNSVVQNMLDMLRRLVGEDVSINFLPAAGLDSIRADTGQMEQMLMNLVVNARDAVSIDGQITIETRNVDLDDSYQRGHEPVRVGRYVMLAVTDNGNGMDENTKSRIFEPFFTTKEKGKGTGLGLSTVYGIVKQSDGYVWVYSEPGKGTTFKIYLPQAGGVADTLVDNSRRSKTIGGSETILLVEDDDALREMIVTMLENRGYQVVQADSMESATRAAGEHAGIIDLLLTDLVMSQGDGIQLTKSLQASQPGIGVLLMSGYAAETIAKRGPLPERALFVEKPFTSDLLLTKIRLVLDAKPTKTGDARVRQH